MLDGKDRHRVAFRSPVPIIGLSLALAVSGPFFKPASATFDAHGGPVKSVAVSADGELALTASFDTSIILWDLASKSVLDELHGHDAAVNAVTFLPDGQALSASDDGTLALWDLDEGAMRARFEGHEGKVVAIAVSSDGRLAASAGWDKTVRLWDLETRSPAEASLQVLETRDNPNAVHFSDDGETVFAGTADGTLTLWRTADGTLVTAIDGHDFAITGLDRKAEDGVIATSSVDETVRLWTIDRNGADGAGEPERVLFGHAGPVLSVDLSDKGDLVASGGIDGTVRVWRRGDGDRLQVFARHKGPVWSVTFTPDGDTLLSGGADGLVLTYDLDAPTDVDVPDEADAVAALDERTDAIERADIGGTDGAAGPLSRGEKLFRTCSACHTLTPDDGHRAGPTLYGLFGRTAGGHPDYNYSEALRESELIWNEETIDQLFSIGPDHLLPGTKMPLQRMPDRQDRADLIAFLKRMTAP